MLIPGRESAHGSKAPARENVGLVALRRLTCVVRQIAGHMRSHAKARGDLHGRRHAHPLRRSDNDLTLEQPLSRRGGVPGTPTTSSKSGQIDPPRLTPRTELGSCRPHGNTSLRGLIGIQDGWMPQQQTLAPARDGPAAVADGRPTR